MIDASQVSRRIEILLTHHNFAAARMLIDNCEREATSVPAEMTIEEKIDLPLADVFDSRLCNALELAGIYTVGDLLDTPRIRLQTIRNLGSAGMRTIFQRLAELGFRESSDC